MAPIKICNKIIEYGFYGIFLLVPLAFTSATSELFELNKMWLTWALTIIIVASWFVKMVIQRRIFIQRTPLDIPIALFLISQIISTIFSLDPHVSLWGYYSRFNGGLLSIISYILLYYAFLSNSPTIVKVQRLLIISLVSGLIVALWGLPSHFGYDPTCFLFRGTLDVSCWTADFIPTVRIFSTLGQPAWLAAYLAILIPISIAFFINNLKSDSPATDNKYHVSSIMYYVSKKPFIHATYYLIPTTLFYIDLLFTRARSGFLGVWLALIFFTAAYFRLQRKKFSIFNFQFSILVGLLLLVTFIIGTPFNQLNKFTLEGIGSYLQKPVNTPSNRADAKSDLADAETQNEGGTESGDIRINVWKGAISAWKANPIFGTGVETFAFAYYKYKPASQNLTSEWNFLYNKAHNEYLNYLATTGLLGLGTYLAMIVVFLYLAIKRISKSEFLIPNQVPNSKSQLGQLEIRSIRNLILVLLAGYISILITNFFGFSVVITNIYLFMIPAFVFALAKFDLVLEEKIKLQTSEQNKSAKINYKTSIWQWMPIFFVSILGIYMLITLFKFWRADIAYALGYNLDRAGEYQQAYPHLHKAVILRGDELVFKDELSINDAYIAAALLIQEPPKDQKEQTISVAESLIQEAINTSNEIISRSQNNAVFWKTRTRLFHTLSQIDSQYLPRALEAIEKASILAPNDANIWYNLGVIYGQNNNIEKGIAALEKTVKLRPNYRDAHYGLGLFYHTALMNEKAIAQMQYILDHIAPQDAGALESIKSWKQ